MNSKGDIVLVNAHVEELFDYHRDELIGKPVDTLVPEGLVANDPPSSGRIFPVPEMRIFDRNGEFRGLRKNGTEFPVEVALNPVESPEGVPFLPALRTFLNSRDQEEARRRREEMSRLQRIGLLAEMTASIAHEINQPLSGIIMNAGTALRFMESAKPRSSGIARDFERRAGGRSPCPPSHSQHPRDSKEVSSVRQRVAINEVYTGNAHGAAGSGGSFLRVGGIAGK